tara:strand:+ start:2923 stop:3705 length:783 start_codon:yes stop_codon:yes gene_type:complete
MTFLNITQQQLNDASYEDLAWLMESVFNTYKVKGASWDKIDKDYLKEKCEEWQISSKGKTDVLVERLQEAQLAYEREQGPTVEDIESSKKLNQEMDKKIVKAKAKLAKLAKLAEVEKPAKKSSKKTLAKKDKGPTVAELKEEAKELGIKGLTKLKKDEIIEAIAKAKAEADEEESNENDEEEGVEESKENDEEDTVVLESMEAKEDEESDSESDEDEDDEDDDEGDDEYVDEGEWVKGDAPNSWVKPSTGLIVWSEEKPE